MPQPIVELTDVSVCYRLPKEYIPSFKEYAIRWLGRRIAYHEFWGLRDFSLSINPGEVVGVVGANGAGKSTLLKVMARVLKPVTGRVCVMGRVGPLLAMSAGFDNELTGRENVFLNGAILGLSRQEMMRRFDDIVAFAELEEFIDAPLRTYSSGMSARLGFAIVTSVDADILLVDEVLAVGDEAFNHKCYERIRGYRDQGTAIVLVSHSMDTIRARCDRAIWIAGGRKMAEGDSNTVVNQYLESVGFLEADAIPENRPIPWIG